MADWKVVVVVVVEVAGEDRVEQSQVAGVVSVYRSTVKTK